MYIKLYSGFLSPIDLRPKSQISKKDIENRIENRLTDLGFKISGSNFAQYECEDMRELIKMMAWLTTLNIHCGEVCWV